MKVKKNNRFYSIFNTLSETERMEFCEFLRLSFVKKPRLSQLVIDKIESGDELHSFLEEKYSDRSLWNIYFELTKSIKQFIAVKEVMENEKEMHNLKRIQLSKRNLSKHLIRDYTNNISVLKSSEFSFSTFNEIHRLALDCSGELSKYGLSKEFSDMYKTHSDFHVISFIFELISHRIEKIIRREFYGDKTKAMSEDMIRLIDIEKTKELITTHYPEYKTILSLLSELYATVSKPDNMSSFKRAKEIFLRNTNLFSEKYKSEIFYTLINMCTLIAQRSKRNLDAEMFDLMKSKLENGFVDDLENSMVGGNHFRDYVYVALNFNKDKWAEDFIKNYSHYLPDDLRDNNVNTAFAFLNLYRKNYTDAVMYISKLKRKFFIHDFDYYTIQIFSYYESGDIIECLRVKKRFQEYFKNNSQFPKSQTPGAENFLKLLSGLIKYKETGNKKLLDDLEYEVENTDELFWRKWLSRMIKKARGVTHKSMLSGQT
jgi:hypothetical protein